MKRETLHYGQVGVLQTGTDFENVHPQGPSFASQFARLSALTGQRELLAPVLGFNTRVTPIDRLDQLVPGQGKDGEKSRVIEGFYRTSEASDGVVVSVTGATRLKIAVLIMNADCGAVEIIAPNGEMAVLHAGLDCVDPKDGTGKSIVENALAYFQGKGIDPQDLHLRVGEAAGPCCYGLSDPRYQKENEARARRLRDQYGNQVVGVTANPPRNGGIAIDVPEIVAEQARQGGIPNEHIIVRRICTSCHGLVEAAMNTPNAFGTWYSNLREDPAIVRERGYGLRNALVVYPTR